MIQDASQNVVLVRFGIIITDEEDCTVGKSTNHQETSNVLVMGVQRCHRRIVLRNEGIGRHRVHMLCYQGGNHTQRSQSQTQLEVQRVVDGVIQTLMTFA